MYDGKTILCHRIVRGLGVDRVGIRDPGSGIRARNLKTGHWLRADSCSLSSRMRDFDDGAAGECEGRPGAAAVDGNLQVVGAAE